MKFLQTGNRLIQFACALPLLLALAACGSGGSDGGGGPVPAAAPLAGTFVDSPVQGLGYTTTPSGLSGVTDVNGQYNYMAGDTVTFTLYGRPLGAAVPATPIVTALSVFNATSITDPQVVNLSQLLLTLGGIPAVGNPIQVPATPPANFPAAINFSDPGFDTAFPGLTLVSEGAANTHLGSSFKTLSVTVVNSGIVTSTPAGINCTAGTCSFAFVSDTAVTLTAVGAGFTGWSGGGCSGSGTCVVTVSADSAVTATFPVAPPPATLTILPNQGTGTGTVSCSADGGAFVACGPSYASGTALVIRAAANGGSTFAGWLDGTGNATSCNNTAVDCSITLTANSSVRANFALSVTLFSVTANSATSNGGGGAVSCSANGGAAGPCGSYPVGAAMVMTATPNSASNFTGWSGAGCSGTGTCSFTLTANTTVTANFNRPILTVVVNGTGSVSSNQLPAVINTCTTTCSAPFPKGAAVSLTASGTGFTGWSGGGCSGSGTTCQVTLTTDTMMTANFSGAGLPPFALNAYVKASNTRAGDQFGFSVALAGDTLAVGADFEDSAATGVNGNQADNSASDSGAVYVFTRTGGAWSQQAYLKASNTGTDDFFGFNVALAGDTLAVGAVGEDSAATGVNGNQADNSAGGSGAVYVFTRTGGVWSQQAYVKASNAEGPSFFAVGSDRFGFSVTLDGDTMAVGANGEDSGATGINGDQTNNNIVLSGAVYVFTRTNGDWSQQAYLKASNTGAEDSFGVSVALAGDTLAVGAFQEESAATGVNGNQADNSALHSGAVYVFTRAGGVWSQQAYVKASNTGVGDAFGLSVALVGNTLAVGAHREGGGGAAYVFTRTNGVWSQQAYLKASNTGFLDFFGSSVAMTGDTLAVGATREDSAAIGVGGNQADNSAIDSGAVYVYRAQ
jgi:FG-GAP repeat/Divergent InlB B-repeat domain